MTGVMVILIGLLIIDVTVFVNIYYFLYYISTTNKLTLFIRAKVATVTKTAMTSLSTQQQHQNHRQYTRASHNVAITVLYTSIIHVVAWTGNQVQVLMTAFSFVDSTSSLFQILILFTYITSCVNPIVYVVKYKEFRQAFNNIVFVSLCKLKPAAIKPRHSTTNSQI